MKNQLINNYIIVNTTAKLSLNQTPNFIIVLFIVLLKKSSLLLKNTLKKTLLNDSFELFKNTVKNFNDYIKHISQIVSFLYFFKFKFFMYYIINMYLKIYLNIVLELNLNLKYY